MSKTSLYAKKMQELSRLCINNAQVLAQIAETDQRIRQMDANRREQEEDLAQERENYGLVGPRLGLFCYVHFLSVWSLRFILF